MQLASKLNTKSQCWVYSWWCFSLFVRIVPWICFQLVFAGLGIDFSIILIIYLRVFGYLFETSWFGIRGTRGRSMTLEVFAPHLLMILPIFRTAFSSWFILRWTRFSTRWGTFYMEVENGNNINQIRYMKLVVRVAKPKLKVHHYNIKSTLVHPCLP